MPFGIKRNHETGADCDFDQVYNQIIKPAVEKANLQCIRADEEKLGGIIHKPMYERLLLVVDQFEETFTRGTSSAGETFLSLLDRASEPGRRTAVVATMRSEYVTELLRAENAERLRSHQFPLAPMSRRRGSERP